MWIECKNYDTWVNSDHIVEFCIKAEGKPNFTTWSICIKIDEWTDLYTLCSFDAGTTDWYGYTVCKKAIEFFIDEIEGNVAPQYLKTEETRDKMINDLIDIARHSKENK